MQVISVTQAINQNSVFVDIRSPLEYEQGHIPGAVNIPLLENDERAIIGTLYKHQGPAEAKRQGLALVSAKLSAIVSQIAQLNISAANLLVVYCWRGGMRSRSILTVLELMDIVGSQLEGGYKAYRNYVQTRLAGWQLKSEIMVLCGSTGTGKTFLLQNLQKRGYPVIDLEGLANHRGSAFGQIGRGKPATAQNFDAELLEQLERFKAAKFILVECESKRIGNVYLPDPLFDAMQCGRKILVKATVSTRVARLIEEYTDLLFPNDPAVVSSLQTLTRKLGKKKLARLMNEYSAGRLVEFVTILLQDYYDGLYGYETAPPEQFDLVVDAEDLNCATDKILAYLDHFARG